MLGDGGAEKSSAKVNEEWFRSKCIHARMAKSIKSYWKSAARVENVRSPSNLVSALLCEMNEQMF